MKDGFKYGFLICLFKIILKWLLASLVLQILHGLYKAGYKLQNFSSVILFYILSMYLKS